MLTIQDLERRFRHHVPRPQDTTHLYAVLVPLVEREGELYLLFEVRSATMRRQPNEVCFPGGRMERGETAEACAVRETTEELGIPPSAIRVIGQLDYIAHYSNLLLYPVLAQIDAGAAHHMTLSPNEVQASFLVPLSFFREHPPALYAYELIPSTDEVFPYERVGFQKPYPFRSGKMIVPVYEKYGGYVVWGLTGRIVRWLVGALSEPMPLPAEDAP